MSLLNKADRAITAIETTGAWLLALLWISPLAYAVWAAVHPSAYSAHFILNAPLTVENFVSAWNAAPFARYFLNTFMLDHHFAAQLILCTLAAYAFARFDFYGRDFVFIVVLISAHDYARRSDCRELPDDGCARHYRYNTGDRPAVYGLRVRDISSETDL